MFRNSSTFMSAGNSGSLELRPPWDAVASNEEESLEEVLRSGLPLC